MSEIRRRQSQLGKLSRFLSMLLRHQPARFPVRLDDQGFADLDDVMRVVQALPNLRWATRADVETVLEQADRKRFELVEDGSGARRIRALYGHTALRPEYEPAHPPATLYCGVAPEEANSILREGLRPVEQKYLQLLPDRRAALSAASRYVPDPIILKIDAEAAFTAGLRFYHPTDEVYLSETIPPEYIGRS